jgi:hypothetical protein
MQSVEINQFVQEKSEMISPIYVIGHVNPDTDSVAAAISYSWLLKERITSMPSLPGQAPSISNLLVIATIGIGSAHIVV